MKKSGKDRGRDGQARVLENSPGFKERYYKVAARVWAGMKKGQVLNGGDFNDWVKELDPTLNALASHHNAWGAVSRVFRNDMFDQERLRFLITTSAPQRRNANGRLYANYRKTR